jgi:hypothetical protein
MLVFVDFRERPVLYVSGQAALQLVQWFFAAVVSTAASGAAAALMRSEVPR